MLIMMTGGSGLDSNLASTSGSMEFTAILGQSFVVGQFSLIEGAPFFFVEGNVTKFFPVAAPNSTLKVFLDSGGGVVNAILSSCTLTLVKLQ